MKKNKFSWLLLLLALISMPFSLASCGGGDDDIDGDGTEINGNNQGGNTIGNEMTPTEQKEYMEKVALDFLDEFKAENFKNICDLTQYISKEYSDYNSDKVTKWFEDYLNEITKYTGSSEEKTYWGYEHFENYTRIYTLSNLKGKLTAEDGKWKYSESNNLQFIVKDSKGNNCVATLTSKGKTKKVYIGDEEDWTHYSYEIDDNGQRFYHDYYDVYNQTIAVPEVLELTLTQGSNTIAKVTITTDLTSMAGEEFDLSKDAYSAKATANINNYEFYVNKAKYTPKGNAVLTYTMKHNNKVLASLEASAEVDVDEEQSSCKNGLVNMSIMGNEIQIKGKCNDILKFSEYLDAAEENDEDEAIFKSYTNLANSLLDLGVYYKGKSNKYASIKLEPVYDDDFWEKHWRYDFVIYFNDDQTTYTLFEVFFNDKDFKSLIRKFENLIEDFADLVEE